MLIVQGKILAADIRRIMASKENAIAILAKNIDLLLDGRSRNAFAAQKLLKQTTLNNMAHAPHELYSPRLDNVQAVANAFGLEVWELLLPDLAAHLAELKARAMKKTVGRRS